MHQHLSTRLAFYLLSVLVPKPWVARHRATPLTLGLGEIWQVLLGEEAYASQRPSLEALSFSAAMSRRNGPRAGWLKAWLQLAPNAPGPDPPESSAEVAEADSGMAEEPGPCQKRRVVGAPTKATKIAVAWLSA